MDPPEITLMYVIKKINTTCVLGKYVLGNRSFSLTIEKQTKNLIHI